MEGPMSSSIRGVTVWGMLPTPFTSDLTGVDHRSLRSVIHYQRQRGVTGFIALGVVAEPDQLSTDEQAEILGTVLDAAGESPVVATAMSLRRDERDRLLRNYNVAAGSALAAVMLPVTSSDGVVLGGDIEHAAAVCGLPVLLQDYPQPTGVHIGIDELVEVVTAHPQVVGVKSEAAPTFSRIRRLKDARPDLHVIAGCGGIGMIEDMLAGADAVACQTTAVQSVCDAARLGLEGETLSGRTVLASSAALINFEVQAQSSIAIRKEHWRRLGVIDHAAVRGDRTPYSPLMSELSDTFGLVDHHTTGDNP